MSGCASPQVEELLFCWNAQFCLNEAWNLITDHSADQVLAFSSSFLFSTPQILLSPLPFSGVAGSYCHLITLFLYLYLCNKGLTKKGNNNTLNILSQWKTNEPKRVNACFVPGVDQNKFFRWRPSEVTFVQQIRSIQLWWITIFFCMFVLQGYSTWPGFNQNHKNSLETSRTTRGQSDS